MSENTTQYVDDTKVIGYMTVPAPSIGVNTIDYYGRIKDVFPDGELPQIKLNKTAFVITAVDHDGRTREVFKAVVTSVRRYATDNDTVDISFRYVRTDGKGRSVKITTVDPVITKIFAHGLYIGLVLEGNREAIDRYIESNLRVFYHGDKTYFLSKTLQLTRRLDDPKDSASTMYHMGTVVIGCTQSLPDTHERDMFTERVLRVIGYAQ